MPCHGQGAQRVGRTFGMPMVTAGCSQVSAIRRILQAVRPLAGDTSMITIQAIYQTATCKKALCYKQIFNFIINLINISSSIYLIKLSLSLIMLFYRP